MRPLVLLWALTVAAVLQGCSREPVQTRVQPPGPSLPDDTPLRGPAIAAAPPRATTPGDRPAAAVGPAAPDLQAPLPQVQDVGDAQGALLLAQRPLLLPVAGVAPSALTDQYALARGSQRVHEAIDIMAPTGTPVVAVDDGRIAKLFTSKAGGLTVYHFDPAGRLAYYYAHLDRYAEGLREGMEVRRGDLIGYVGASGNANPQAPHLHFAVFRLGQPPRWWEGEPVNPYPALSRAATVQQLASR